MYMDYVHFYGVGIVKTMLIINSTDILYMI